MKLLRLVLLCIVCSGCPLQPDKCTSILAPSLFVTVLDGATGGPAAAPSTFALLQAGQEAGSVIASTDGHLATFYPVQAGTYDVLVKTPGYRDRLDAGIKMKKNGCGLKRVDLTERIERN